MSNIKSARRGECNTHITPGTIRDYEISLELPPEGIVGSEVGSAEGLVRDVGSGIFTTIFSLPSFLCVLLFIYLLSVLLS